MSNKSTRGLSFILAFGPPAWPMVEYSKDYIRLVLGPVAFWIMFHDFELFLSKVLKLAARK